MEGAETVFAYRQATHVIFERLSAGGCQSYLIGCADSCAAVLIDPEITLIDRYHAPYLAAAVVGIAIAIAIGIVVALPALRLCAARLSCATLSL